MQLYELLAHNANAAAGENFMIQCTYGIHCKLFTLLLGGMSAISFSKLTLPLFDFYPAATPKNGVP